MDASVYVDESEERLGYVRMTKGGLNWLSRTDKERKYQHIGLFLSHIYRDAPHFFSKVLKQNPPEVVGERWSSR